MPAYTILLMRKDATDRRPLTIHIGAKMFWTLLVMAITAPIVGFLVSAGVVAPAWLRLNMKSMQQEVETAEKNLQPLQQQNADLAAKKQQLEKQLQEEREFHATAETRITMAESAQKAASEKLATAETELFTLKQSLATYEKLLKPKIQRELVQCVNLQADYTAGAVNYQTDFAKIAKSTNVPGNLTVRVRVLAGDNAVAMEQGTSANTVVSHQLDLARTSNLKGRLLLPANQAQNTTRVLDVKVLDGSQKTVGYCWKAF